jgi:ubiquinone/menaquinone biosynthesis C-methylase UbiE
MIRIATSKQARARVHVLNIDECVLTKTIPRESVDIITCCHSFPYYRDKCRVLQKLYDTLKPGGIAIFVQASINNVYDRLVMAVIERTAERAEYLSRHDFRTLAEPLFTVQSTFQIKERFFMPSICGFGLEKRV